MVYRESSVSLRGGDEGWLQSCCWIYRKKGVIPQQIILNWGTHEMPNPKHLLCPFPRYRQAQRNVRCRVNSVGTVTRPQTEIYKNHHWISNSSGFMFCGRHLFLRGQINPGVNLSTYVHLMPRLRNSGAIPPSIIVCCFAVLR